MTLEEIKQLMAEPGVRSVEVQPDGTVVILKSAPDVYPLLVDDRLPHGLRGEWDHQAFPFMPDPWGPRIIC